MPDPTIAESSSGSAASLPPRLVVGLGNPGAGYAATRHNAGFWWIEALARQHHGQFRPESRYHGETGRISLEGREVWLLKPMTFMNRSGQAVAALARFLRIALPEILVAHDDLDLPPGVARLKRAGGHGGHNGLRDLIAHLGGNDFARLRLGIGHPGDSRAVLDYVLRRPPQTERELLEEAIAAALEQWPRLAAGDWAGAMQDLHSRRPAATVSTLADPSRSA